MRTFCRLFLLMGFIITGHTHTFSFIIDLAALTAFNIYNWKLLLDACNPQNADTTSCAQHQKSRPATFADVAGTLSPEIKELPDFIKNSSYYQELGARIPKGILLYGPPGTGKTSIARAIAGEADAAFVSASASEFIEMYVGVGPQRIRELFEKAEQERIQGNFSHAIVFIDEIDAIGGKRSGEMSSEYRNTLNELLNQMDGFHKNSAITVIAATNTPTSLDAALLRRFERKVEIGLPDEKNRYEILKLYVQKIRFAGSDDVLHALAKKSERFSGAELELVVNEAACLAARDKAPWITDEHILLGFKKIAAGKSLR